MPKARASNVERTRVRPEKGTKGELGTNLSRIGEPYTPKTPEEKSKWQGLVKQGLAGLLGVADTMGAAQEDVDHVIEAIGFKDMYAMGSPG